jgi:hypothetical protein
MLGLFAGVIGVGLNWTLELRTSLLGAGCLSDMVVSCRRGASMLAPHSAQKIVPSNCFVLQLLQICMVSGQLSVVSSQ